MPSLPLIYPVSCHVTDFGAVVFWGVPRGEEAVVLKTLRHFVNKGLVGAEEFSSGEDDLAFVTSADIASIKIANDVIELPENSEPKQRLSVSFAIAQSSVLAIFESRIERKIEEYKYIPEALAAHGKVHLSELQLGMMIGEVFVIRHDVNLHTEILGTVVAAAIVPSCALLSAYIVSIILSLILYCSSRYPGLLLERAHIRAGLPLRYQLPGDEWTDFE